MSIFAKAEIMIAGRFDSMASLVTYRRGAATVSALAILAKTPYESRKGQSMVVRIEGRDFILRKADIAIQGDPKIGDEIIFNENLYRVVPLGDQPCWSWHGRTAKEFIRVHTKLIGDLS